MKVIQSWPNKWFGLWKEQGVGYEKCPSLNSFIYPDLVKEYSLTKLFYYLEHSQTIATTSGSSFADVITGQTIKESISYKTDGIWLWLDSLPHYVKEHNVAIPISFLHNIEVNKYSPVSWSGELQSLDWPPLA